MTVTSLKVQGRRLRLGRISTGLLSDFFATEFDSVMAACC